MAEKDNKYLWKLDKFNGGIADDSAIGLSGAFRYGVGLDIHSDSKLLSLSRKTTKVSGLTVAKLIKGIEINPSNNDVYYYGEDTIYKESSSVFSSVHTISLDSPNGQGICDFDGYLYYRSATNLGRFDYSSSWTDNWQTGLTSISTFSPMMRFKNYLLVGHGRYVGTVDDLGTWTADTLTLPPNYTVRAMDKVGSYAIITAMRGSSVTDSEEGMMFLWDGNASQYNEIIPLDGNPHAIRVINNRIVIIAGNTPNIQESVGGVADIKMEIPKVGIGSTCEIYPNAIDVWNHKIFFGISAGTTTTAIRSLYSWGAKSSKFNTVLNPELKISNGVYTGAEVRITAVKRVGTSMRVAWKYGDTYGIDNIDTTGYQTSGLYRSLAFDRQSPYMKMAQKVFVELAKPLRTGESIAVKISPDPYGDEDFTSSPATYLSSTLNTVGETELDFSLTSQATQINSRDLHLEIALAGNGTTTPYIKRVWSEFDENQIQI